MRLSEKKSPALVLSGGGVKAAAFHIGVCLALREKGFKFAGGSPRQVEKNFSEDKLTFKTYVGSSAGSVISTYLAAGYSIDAIIDSFTQGAGLSAVAKKRENTESFLRPLTYGDMFRPNIKAGCQLEFLTACLKNSHDFRRFRGHLEAWN